MVVSMSILIPEQWDQLVRVGASLRHRTALAHVVLDRLAGSSPSGRLSKAAWCGLPAANFLWAARESVTVNPTAHRPRSPTRFRYCLREMGEQATPNEAEWEFASRGGLSGKLYAWGDEFEPVGKFMANTYLGQFPVKDTGEDDFAGTSPVGSFPADGYGLYDMGGSVWQWCSDWYHPDYFKHLAEDGNVARNPQGPEMPFDPDEPTEKKRVQKGGSFLCTDQYCTRYIVGMRGKGEVNTGTNHLGFRCALAPMISGTAKMWISRTVRSVFEPTLCARPAVGYAPAVDRGVRPDQVARFQPQAGVLLTLSARRPRLRPDHYHHWLSHRQNCSIGLNRNFRYVWLY